MVSDRDDLQVRQMAFELLSQLTLEHGDTLPFAPLSRGVRFRGTRVPLLGPQGIFKPKVLDLPLTIATAPNGPYNDTFEENGLLSYRYRGSDPLHKDNVGLRELMRLDRPLIYLHGVVKGQYVPAWPVFIVSDNPTNLTFTVAVDEKETATELSVYAIADPAGAEARRRYATSAVRVRLHQRTFRARVLAAYREQCALCRLRHTELLEAAHIIPDSDEAGEPVISNGVALCTLHHAAFDRNILGIRPDLVVEIRLDILKEVDGPMLRYGLQEMHGVKLRVPRRTDHQPNPEALALRYEQFRIHS